MVGAIAFLNSLLWLRSCLKTTKHDETVPAALCDTDEICMIARAS